ncbi:hypothetical protein AK812_SmicGene43620 [Symbiodinium microadriaticum]|uniref:CSD domain-containing protein n=1 Tax=Symbiodinium microadriaticum TaxID=2951 RepID=A0A1Q9C0L2_SYMMI|nr:hypothetical protein AK812_SmicGene43620 [Symbiodinium microadriaticum]
MRLAVAGVLAITVIILLPRPGACALTRLLTSARGGSDHADGNRLELELSEARPGRRNSEGFGFVKVDGDKDGGGGDLFLYADSIKDPKLRSEAKIFGLKNHQRIKFDIEEPLSARKSRLAINVMPMRDEDDRRPAARDRSRSRRRSPSPPRRRTPFP